MPIRLNTLLLLWNVKDRCLGYKSPYEFANVSKLFYRPCLDISSGKSISSNHVRTEHVSCVTCFEKYVLVRFCSWLHRDLPVEGSTGHTLQAQLHWNPDGQAANRFLFCMYKSCV